MPVVARIDGIKVMFYYEEHPPPHFHVSFGEHVAQLDLDTLDVIVGDLPSAQLRKIRSWADSRKEALKAAWIACQSDTDPGKIA